ncbi:MAG TPA: DinB family protein, partial [Streptosporangiaceae bacterium]|nr:DinB family protein [Streptosporangiaceae bacterium]
MRTADVLADSFGRVHYEVHQCLDGLAPGDLAYRPDGAANSIAWLIWHLTRIQDDHVAHVAGTEQVWLADGWFDRFGLPFLPTA